MGKRILLVGGGGHCKSVLDTLQTLDLYSEIGIIDIADNIGSKILSVPIIGCDEDLTRLYQDGFQEAFVTVGSIGDTNLRVKLFEKLEKIGFNIPNIIDITASISRHVKLGTGIFIGKNAVVNAGSIIHKGVIINTSAIIEHDCTIEEFSHVSPGVVICGEVRVNAKSHIGANSVIRQQLTIGASAIIGIGSVVVNDIESEKIAYGNPCKLS